MLVLLTLSGLSYPDASGIVLYALDDSSSIPVSPLPNLMVEAHLKTLSMGVIGIFPMLCVLGNRLRLKSRALFNPLHGIGNELNFSVPRNILGPLCLLEGALHFRLFAENPKTDFDKANTSLVHVRSELTTSPADCGSPWSRLSDWDRQVEVVTDKKLFFSLASNSR